MAVQAFSKNFFNVFKSHIADDLCSHIMVIGGLTLLIYFYDFED